MRVLVTGGAGFIGSNFVHHLVSQKSAERIVVLDSLTYAGNLKNLQAVRDQVHFIRGSINDASLVREILKEEKISHVAHFAAESHVDRSIHGPDAFVETNVVGTHVLLKACREVWMATSGADVSGKRFLHVSTDEVFGTLAPNDPPFSETTPYSPNSPYSATKAGSDHLVRAYHETYGLPTVISNCSNNYGAFQFPEKLIPLMILNVVQGKPLPVYGDGMQIRDWLHVLDHCRALEVLLTKAPIGETFCIGGNSEVPNIQIVKTICELVDASIVASPALREKFPKSKPALGQKSVSLITHVQDRPGHDRRYAINTSKISRELGFSPRETLESGLQKTVQWYLDNTAWWQEVTDGTYRQWLDLNYTQR